MSDPPDEPRPIHVVVADDHVLSRRHVVATLSRDAGCVVVGEAADGRAAVALVRRLQPDVVVMDIHMPILDGIAATRRIRALGASRVVLISADDRVLYGPAAMAAGAAAWWSKTDPESALVAAVRAVASGADDPVAPPREPRPREGADTEEKPS